ncbi:hypothetical protein GCM10020220_089860 [Nonomuraea rubra]
MRERRSGLSMPVPGAVPEGLDYDAYPHRYKEDAGAPAGTIHRVGGERRTVPARAGFELVHGIASGAAAGLVMTVVAPGWTGPWPPWEAPAPCWSRGGPTGASPAAGGGG